MKKIAFHSNQLCLRGTEVALYTYAKYNEEVLGNKSVIFSNPNANLDALPKFKERFEVILMDWGSYETYLKENNFDYLYIIKGGNNDGYCLPETSIPTIIHAVFRYNDPHGYKYVYVSDWLARDQGYNPEQYSLPHICEPLPQPIETLHSQLGIKSIDTVFGCYGGRTEFNIQSTKEAIISAVSLREDIKFIFMNIDKFVDHPQVIFLPGTYDLQVKSNFVHTCDAMIHARSGGETFGLAVAEFALANKPVITYELSGERNHIEVLGDTGIYYKGKEDLLDIFLNFSKYKKDIDYSEPYKQFNPEAVMSKFNKLLK